MVIGGGGLAWYYHDAIFGKSNSRAGRLERELNIGAQMLNRRAPIRVDEITTLVGADVEGTHLAWNLQFSQDIPTERLEEARQALLQQAGSQLCSDPSMGEALRSGAVISADYRDASGDHIRITFPSCTGYTPR